MNASRDLTNEMMLACILLARHSTEASSETSMAVSRGVCTALKAAAPNSMSSKE